MPFVAIGAHQMTSSISLVVEIELKDTLLEFSFLLSFCFSTTGLDLIGTIVTSTRLSELLLPLYTMIDWINRALLKLDSALIVETQACW